FLLSISAVQTETTLKAKLEALQCHFTWDLKTTGYTLFRLRDNLEDIGTEEGNSWLGHTYNLEGYIHYQLGSIDDARSLFSRAAEAFRQMRNTVSDEGPWLVVNYGNKAWLHFHQGEQAESQACLSKVEELMKEYPSPSQDELHPEIYAEKAWTLMKFGPDQKLLAADYFQRAIRMQPDMVEWQTSHVLALVNPFNHSNLRDDILEKMKIAKEHDPENLYLAALYLEARAKKGEQIEGEARELAIRVLRKPVSSYSGIEPLLRVYRVYLSNNEAIDLAEEALERHPDERYLKRRAAICYEKRIFSDSDGPLENSMIDRAISLHKEVISLYPDSSLKRKIYLASIYARSNHSQEADQIYEELLQSDLDPGGTQMLYNYYAKHLHFIHQRMHESIKYHMRAAAIPQQSFLRENSISILRRIRDRNRNRMCGEIEEFLANLQL
ncbi:interferon-induced protein with tetratricopeptide repeats 2-like, partial [Seriola aureovittata]|uniref:interferon-induced protein with tetratricopeptide repeats 2-like n=1 Tax=Seriola aureovittata TaxID=2871759 RepID=UPI0024BED7E5